MRRVTRHETELSVVLPHCAALICINFAVRQALSRRCGGAPATPPKQAAA